MYDEQDHDGDPMRGIVYGVIFSVPLWAIIFGVVWGISRLLS